MTSNEKKKFLQIQQKAMLNKARVAKKQEKCGQHVKAVTLSKATREQYYFLHNPKLWKT